MQRDTNGIRALAGELDAESSNQLIESGFGCPIAMPPSETVVRNATDTSRKRSEYSLADAGQAGQDVFGNERWPDGIDREAFQQCRRLERSPRLLRLHPAPLMQATRRDYGDVYAVETGQSRLNTSIIEDVDSLRLDLAALVPPWGAGAGEDATYIRARCKLLNECPADGTTRADHDRLNWFAE